MKKMISIVLCLLFLLPLTGPAFAEDVLAKKISITVNFNGTDFAANALQTEGEKILVPVKWIQYFGSMKMIEEGRYYKFYYVGQEEAAPFAKRIYIEKNGKSFDIRYYENNSSFLDELAIFKNWVLDSVTAISSKSMQGLRKAWNVKERELKKMEGENHNSFSICSGKFSDQEIYQDQLYLPLEEVLPFINAKVGISEEGKLLIYPNPTSLSQALYQSQLGNLMFNADRELSYNGNSYADGLSGTAYVVDTLLNLRYDRLLFHKAASAADYEKLFKTYLNDNEAYLSAFDEELSPIQKSYQLITDAFEVGETALKAAGNTYKSFEAIDLPEELYSDNFYKTLYKDFEGIDFKGMDIVEGFGKVLDYHNTYANQVEDHRHMLTVVFSRDYEDLLARYSSAEAAIEALGDNYFSPAYIAARNIEKLYSEDISNRLLAASDKALRDYITQDLLQESINKKLAPYIIARDITKLIVPEAFEGIENYSLIGYMDNSVSTAYDVYLSYKFGDDYSTKTLNKLRLSAIMALISSKHAYANFPCKNSGRIKDIDSLLTKLYLAADGVECDSSDYYGKKKSELKKNLKKIITTDRWNDNEGPINSAPATISGYLGMTIKEIAEIWGNDYTLESNNVGGLTFYYEDFRIPFWATVYPNNYDKDTNLRIEYIVFENDWDYNEIFLAEWRGKILTNKLTLNELRRLDPECFVSSNEWGFTEGGLKVEYVWYECTPDVSIDPETDIADIVTFSFANS